MKKEQTDEIRDRALAFRLLDKGKSPTHILQHLGRLRAWLFKWTQRFEHESVGIHVIAQIIPEQDDEIEESEPESDG